MNKFSFYFLTPLSTIAKLSCHPRFLGPNNKNSKLCNYLALYSLNKTANNFSIKIINFQSLAFNGLKTLTEKRAHKVAEATRECIGNKIADKFVTKTMYDENSRNVKKIIIQKKIKKK